MEFINSLNLVNKSHNLAAFNLSVQKITLVHTGQSIHLSEAGQVIQTDTDAEYNNNEILSEYRKTNIPKLNVGCVVDRKRDCSALKSESARENES